MEKNALLRFQEYCSKHCVERKVNLQNLMIKENGMRELCKIIQESGTIARMNLRENILRDSVMEIFAPVLENNKSICYLDVCQAMITPKGFKRLFKAMLVNESVTAIEIGNPGNTNRNRIGQ